MAAVFGQGPLVRVDEYAGSFLCGELITELSLVIGRQDLTNTLDVNVHRNDAKY